jgi:hypothetical protein
MAAIRGDPMHPDAAETVTVDMIVPSSSFARAFATIHGALRFDIAAAWSTCC